MRKKTKKVALFFEMSAVIDRRIMHGIVRYSSLRDPWIFYLKVHPFYMLPQSNPWHKLIMPELKKWRPDGIIAHVDMQKAEDLISIGVPTIIMPIGLEEVKNAPILQSDKEAVIDMGTSYLMNLGFRNIAFCGFGNVAWSQVFSDIFANRIVRAGFNAYVYKPPAAFISSFVKEDNEFLCDWLRTLPKPIGVMACNDIRGRQVIEAANVAGLTVPDDVAVLGVDNDDLICDVTCPPLSSVALGLEKAGYEAAKLLDRMMGGEKNRIKNLFWQPTQVITRQSTDILAIEDHEVANAIRFIQTNAKLDLSVDEVVDNTTLGRRALEQRFRTMLNKTIREEIRRVCVERISRMLLETNMTVYQITSVLGSSDGGHLARTFRIEKGMSPKEYRRKHSIL